MLSVSGLSILDMLPVSGLSILDCPFGFFSNVYWLPVMKKKDAEHKIPGNYSKHSHGLITNRN
jgi:hypothetical protein